MLFRLKALGHGKHIGELISCRHSVETKMPKLCCFMLPDFLVLGSLSARLPPITLLVHSIHAVLSYTGFGDLGSNAIFFSN